ncbi:MAG TPA: PTS ascorbate transporter subunit IIC [Gemmatimonadaceae bacterium]|nr:PTS ascorbate transporter subunit IIC [Gemmatimonadaceae bacterium]HRQ77086.1 PTS ascorbate transporter subunit IIC [Gemmatimonadaceae bacterium]
MAEKKPFLLRVDRSLLEAYQRWAADELRSVNGQLEFVLRDALRRAGRKTDDGSQLQPDGESPDDA